MSQRPLFQFAEVEPPRRPSPQRRRRERHADHLSGDLEIGKAAEHLVCYDILLKGYNAFLSDQGLPYDIIVDLGSRILRVQVKGTRRPKNPMPGHRLSDGYFFHIRNEFDMYALVALDIHAIAYFAKDALILQTVSLRVPGIQYHHDSRAVRRFENADFERALTSVLENS